MRSFFSAKTLKNKSHSVCILEFRGSPPGIPDFPPEFRGTPGIPEFTPEFRGTPPEFRISPRNSGEPSRNSGEPPRNSRACPPHRNTGGKTGEFGKNAERTPVFRGGSPEKTRVNPGFSTFYDACICAHTLRICAHIILT